MRRRKSCTGGLIAACLTEIAGSSDVVDRGFVTYSNEAKRDLLGVPDELLVRVGAVSEEVARAMATGAVARSDAALADRGDPASQAPAEKPPPSRSAWCTTPAPRQTGR